jgi:pilus assembly protein Flp/PilA
MMLQAYTWTRVAASDLRSRMHDRFVELFRTETGATAAEYALLIALIAVAIIAGAAFLGTSVNDKLQETGDAVVNAPAVP